ncbi:MAG TPA: Cof-type HAD-IIB family hydrolase [Candidatus Mcinerneyibacterium sp.]|nr:Cof-type HAD-IIB family hydrolase [Candidatus Mcinerneyibacterium sp.]
MLNDLDKKIYISDLDGTLLNSKAKLSIFTRKRLKYLIKIGVNFTIATARSLHSLNNVLKDVNFKLPIIELNGALISDYKTKNHLKINSINFDVATDIYNVLNDTRHWPVITTYDGKKDNVYITNIDNKGLKNYYNQKIIEKDNRLRTNTNIEKILSQEIICFTIIGRKTSLTKLYKRFVDNFMDKIEIHFFENDYFPGWYWITLHDIKANKLNGIKTILKQYNFSKQNLTVFGDHINDIKMFKYSKNSIAVENAKSSLKKYATHSIGHNNDDSVVKYIYEDLNL